MDKIIVSFGKKIVKTALIENGKPVEIIIDKDAGASLVGNIYAGVVKNILPSRFAFIDIGTHQNAFLQFSDKKEVGLYKNGELALKIGQTVIVQVEKDSLGTKGPALTTRISFSSKNFIIIKDDKEEIFVSGKIVASSQRARLKKVVKPLAVGRGFSVILRTDSALLDKSALYEQFVEALEFADTTLKFSQFTMAPSTIFRDEFSLEKTFKALLNATCGEVIIDSHEKFDLVSSIVSKLSFDCHVRVFDDEIDLFSAFSINFEKLLKEKVWLPSGGYLIIEQTEAAVVIDVNTGKFINGKNERQIAIKTNAEAAKEISSQLRLRNLSGMIIIDFIDLNDELEKKVLAKILEESTKNDRLSVNVLGVTHLSVGILTRKKQREPLTKFLDML